MHSRVQLYDTMPLSVFEGIGIICNTIKFNVILIHFVTFSFRVYQQNSSCFFTPSVSFAASSPKGGAHAQNKFHQTLCKTPQSRTSRDSFSLRLGHVAALTVHRTVIHYRADTALPYKGAHGVGCHTRLRYS